MSKVQLYVYDLSNGLAKALSMQLTGKQIDGIWHTSVVVFGKEHFYGAGICITPPGESHLGKPLQMLDMGETEIDQETFSDYIQEMRSHYTADKYHLLENNCNSFTNDCIGFLTGGSIPSWIKDLPSDFLSTPFGAALRPTIDAMFRRPAAGAAPVPAPAPSPQAAINAAQDPQLAASLLQTFASRAQQSGYSMPSASQHAAPSPATSTLTGPIHVCTNPSSFASLLSGHRAVVAFFTSAGCMPCRMIEPEFESLAHQQKQAAFVKVDLGAGMGSQVASQYGIRATPTFLFFLDGKKIHELKGANAPELRSQAGLLVFQAFPPHRHTKLSLPTIEALSLEPILFKQVPQLDTLQTRLASFIDTCQPTSGAWNKDQIKSILADKFVSYLKTPVDKRPAPTPASSAVFTGWAMITASLAKELPSAQLFPLVDLWRLALLDGAAAQWCAALPPGGAPDPVAALTTRAIAAFDQENSRNLILTTLRMVANAFAAPALARRVLLAGGGLSARRRTTALVVPALLHGDAAVRTAAASLAFNMSAWLQKGRVERLKGGATNAASDAEEEAEWEIEMVSAVLEALARETDSEDVVHRLTASLAFLLRLSPMYDEQLVPLLDVFQARETLKGKLQPGGCGAQGVQKADVRKLITETVDKLMAGA